MKTLSLLLVLQFLLGITSFSVLPSGAVRPSSTSVSTRKSETQRIVSDLDEARLTLRVRIATAARHSIARQVFSNGGARR
jgi:hypothetical protein